MGADGSLTRDLAEGSLCAAHTVHNLTIELMGDTWLHPLPSSSLLSGLVSSAAEAGGWNAVVLPALTAKHAVVLHNTTLAIYFRGEPLYDIASPETIAIEVPAAAVSSGQVPPNVPTFVVQAAAGQVAFSAGLPALLYGELLNSSVELTLVGAERQQLIMQLKGNTWAGERSESRTLTRTRTRTRTRTLTLTLTLTLTRSRPPAFRPPLPC